MLLTLNIKDIALIDELTIDFSPGMNVLTGETGAGKSIIVDSLNLALGERADKDLISAGSETAYVDAVFEISEKIKEELINYGIPSDEDMLIFSREISKSGKNICRINGRLVTLSMLKDISDKLVDIHGQHEHQSLLNEKNHLGFLDNYGEKEIFNEKASVKDAYTAYSKTLSSLNKLKLDGDRERKLDILKYQIDEIGNAKLKVEEEAALLEERMLQRNSESISSALEKSYECLYGDINGAALTNLKETVSAMKSIAAFSADYERLMQRLSDSYYSLEECMYDIRDLKNKISFDESAQENIENRLAQINTLKRKYGGSIEEVLKFGEKAQEEYDTLLNSEQIIKTLTEELSIQKEKLISLQNELSQKRKKVACDFERDIIDQLSDLGFNSCEFSVSFLNEDKVKLAENGQDEVEFYISLNKGQPLRALKKIASGGEVSRIMLALKNIQAGADQIDSCVFDEIDTGISGKTANTVAKKMAKISIGRQVICVTHLPQIAVMADKHFIITKENAGHTVRTNVVELDRKNRIDEIARLSGGEVSKVSALHADEMLNNADEIKKQL